MNRGIKIVVYGFFMWLIPFLVSLVIYPLKTFAYPLFESIMPVVIAITAVFLGITYFKSVFANYLNEGLLIGGSWFVICISIDSLLFLSPSPMQMSITKLFDGYRFYLSDNTNYNNWNGIPTHEPVKKNIIFDEIKYLSTLRA